MGVVRWLTMVLLLTSAGSLLLKAQAARTVWDGVYTDAQAARGTVAFVVPSVTYGP